MPEEIIRRVLRLTGYEVHRQEFDEASSTVTLWIKQVGADPFHTCRGCGIGTRRVHSTSARRVRDLPWGEWKVWLVVRMHRVKCRRCGVRSERIDWLEGKHPFTRRFSQAVARDCEDAAVSRVASKWGLSARTVRRIDKRALLQWSQDRSRRPLRYMGVDEIFWKKGACVSASIRALLYGVTEHDALTFVGVPIVVIAVTLVACAGPARRAGRVDPARELRS